MPYVAVLLILLAAAGAAFLWTGIGRQEAAAQAPPAALDYFDARVDLTQIEAIQPLGERQLALWADGGKRYTLEFTAPCDGLRQARAVSFATGDYRDLNRFVGIVLDGRLCTLKDFRSGS